jgi:hypothetical protein
VKNYLIGRMDAQTRKSLQDMLNQVLATPRELDYRNELIDVDYSFVDEGLVIKNDYVSFVLDGTFSPAKSIQNIT